MLWFKPQPIIGQNGKNSMPYSRPALGMAYQLYDKKIVRKYPHPMFDQNGQKSILFQVSKNIPYECTTSTRHGK